MNIKKYSDSVFIILCLFLILVIGIIRYHTGPELAFSLFYLFPIIFVTWHVGRWAGVLIATASTISWLVADLLMLSSFSNSFIPYLNETFRLIVFLIITEIIYRLKIAIENHKEIARTDHLTEIANRRAFFDLANLELNKARRYKTTISVLYLDIDNFKHINDLFGHHAGDRLLRSVAQTIKNNIRTVDISARLGGDEFAILLSETDSESAALVVKKLKIRLLELIRRNGWPATLSIGVVTFRRIPASVDEMIAASDAQMYLAKQNGKNRTRYKVIGDDESEFRSVVNV